jgi:hypothetical protein
MFEKLFSSMSIDEYIIIGSAENGRNLVSLFSTIGNINSSKNHCIFFSEENGLVVIISFRSYGNKNRSASENLESDKIFLYEFKSSMNMNFIYIFWLLYKSSAKFFHQEV